MGARPYVPSLGRFLSVDPVEGGSCNDYEYTCGDPVNSSDPSGKKPKKGGTEPPEELMGPCSLGESTQEFALSDVCDRYRQAKFLKSVGMPYDFGEPVKAIPPPPDDSHGPIGDFLKTVLVDAPPAVAKPVGRAAKAVADSPVGQVFVKGLIGCVSALELYTVAFGGLTPIPYVGQAGPAIACIGGAAAGQWIPIGRL